MCKACRDKLESFLNKTPDLIKIPAIGSYVHYMDDNYLLARGIIFGYAKEGLSKYKVGEIIEVSPAQYCCTVTNMSRVPKSKDFHKEVSGWKRLGYVCNDIQGNAIYNEDPNKLFYHIRSDFIEVPPWFVKVSCEICKNPKHAKEACPKLRGCDAKNIFG